MRKSIWPKIAIAVCIILLLLLALGGGTLYWSIEKFREIVNSAINASRGTLAAPPEISPATNINMPATEVAGQDLPEAPPYAGSIRSNYYISDDKNFISVEYFVPATAEQINEFYKNYLKENDWILSTFDQRTTTFLKEGNNLALAIVAQNKDLPVTQYSLNLTKYSK